MSNAPITVTVDGPAGAGKSTVARGAAQRLGYLYIDTGALYRAVAWLAGERGLHDGDPTAVVQMAETMDLRLESGEAGVRVWVEGREITGALRTPTLSQLASKLSALPGVRAQLVERQRAFGRAQSIVIEGRDTGTVIFPEAACKIYLDAGLEERARRRLLDLREAGDESTMGEVMEEMRRRDERDMNREHAPLRPAEDAHRIDCTTLTIDEVVDQIVAAAHAAEEQQHS